jgi:hypothetical protein
MGVRAFAFRNRAPLRHRFFAEIPIRRFRRQSGAAFSVEQQNHRSMTLFGSPTR